MVRDAIELSIASLDRLRPGRWLDMYIIAAAMELSDRPPYVRYGLSVALDGHNKAGEKIPNTNPFGLWRRKIDEYRHEVGHEVGQDAALVYFCPLNLNTDHFTLLEINEPQKTIYHYNSMAEPGVVCGKTKRTRVRRTVEVRRQGISESRYTR